ncbi:MAG: hypothetical protein ABIR81_10570 [Ginsengibacter sp.]
MRLQNNAELLSFFEDNMEAARKALQETNDEALQVDFTLKANGQVLYKSLKVNDIYVTLNHWVHRRGQFFVYMRLNDLPVPSIYGLLQKIEVLHRLRHKAS